MDEEVDLKEKLLKVLRAELENLLCAEGVSEKKKLLRIKQAQEIIEYGEISDDTICARCTRGTNT